MCSFFSFIETFCFHALSVFRAFPFASLKSRSSLASLPPSSCESSPPLSLFSSSSSPLFSSFLSFFFFFSFFSFFLSFFSSSSDEEEDEPLLAFASEREEEEEESPSFFSFSFFFFSPLSFPSFLIFFSSSFTSSLSAPSFLALFGYFLIPSFFTSETLSSPRSFRAFYSRACLALRSSSTRSLTCFASSLSFLRASFSR